MPPSDNSFDVVVIGGGVIGQAIAWRARERGMNVTVLERHTLGCGASRVAAGMLAPVAEADFGEAARAVLQLGLRSVQRWPSFAEQLQAASGVQVPLRPSGTLLLARDEDEARELERQISLRESLGLRTRRLRPSEARELEPALAPTIRLALEVPDEYSVDPRLLLDALTRACERSGVVLRQQTEAESIEVDGDGRACGVRLADGELIRASHVVLAAGAWSDLIGGAAQRARTQVRPVKGQIIRLADPSGPGLLQRVIRYQGGYIVPRGDGRYVLGATAEEQGFNDKLTAGGIYALLREAWEVLPGVAELEIEEIAVGFRPGTPDNVPRIGASPVQGLLWATGHYRNGILLTPLTADLALQSLLQDQSESKPAADSPQSTAGLPVDQPTGRAEEQPA